MDLFSEFDATQWQVQDVRHKTTVLMAPGGHRIEAAHANRPMFETPHDAQEFSIYHDIPVWSLESSTNFLGNVYRHSHDPVRDIQRALDRRRDRLQLLARIEAWALSGGVGPGRWCFHAGQNCLHPDNIERRILIPWGPCPLLLLVQTAHILVQKPASCLSLGSKAVEIIVPASRHASMERLAQLRKETPP